MDGVDIVLVWKRKGDVARPWKYQCITLLSSVLKMLERILNVKIRRIVEGEVGEQNGFRRGRGTADGMFTLRQLVEKKLEGEENMALGFIDIEKAYHTCSSEIYDHGHVEVNGCPRGGGEGGRRHK